MNYKRVYNICDAETASYLIVCKKKEIFDEKFWQLTESINNVIIEKIKEDFEYTDPLYGDGWLVRSYGDSQNKRGMKLHIDNENWGPDHDRRIVEHRVITTTTSLNTNFLGGEFLFEDSKFFPSIGQTIILDSSFLHGCADVIHGIRYVFLSWYRNTPRPDGDAPWYGQFLGKDIKNY